MPLNSEESNHENHFCSSLSNRELIGRVCLLLPPPCATPARNRADGEYPKIRTQWVNFWDSAVSKAKVQTPGARSCANLGLSLPPGITEVWKGSWQLTYNQSISTASGMHSRSSRTLLVFLEWNRGKTQQTSPSGFPHFPSIWDCHCGAIGKRRFAFGGWMPWKNYWKSVVLLQAGTGSSFSLQDKKVGWQPIQKDVSRKAKLDKFWPQS